MAENRKLGVVSDYIEAKALRDLSSRAAREKLSIALGERNAAKIFETMDEATKSLELRSRVAANSATARRTMTDAEVTEAMKFTPAQIARDTASGNLQGGKRVLETMVDDTSLDQLRRKDKVYGEISDFLLGQRVPAPQAAGLIDSALRQTARNSALDIWASRETPSNLGILGYLLGTQPQKQTQP